MALAQMLQTDFEIFFVCIEIPDGIKLEIKKLGFKLFVINNEREFLSELKNDTIVVLDHYGLDSNYQKSIKAKGCKLVCIDDLHDKVFFADLIINHAPGVKPEYYTAQFYTKFALGLSYALLRPAFLEQAKIKTAVNKKIETLFICFGGADPRNFTERILRLTKGITDFTKIVVVTGAAFENLSSLQQIILNDNRIIHYQAINENQMLAVLKDVDLAIVPASGILYEVLTLRIPVITGSYVNNQSIFIAEMIKYRQVINSIDFSDMSLTNAIKQILQKRIEYDEIFDGHSGDRISNLFKGL